MTLSSLLFHLYSLHVIVTQQLPPPRVGGFFDLENRFILLTYVKVSFVD